MSSTRPSFDSLPYDKNGPHGNAWGVFGEKDELGMLNLLTPATTSAAAKEIIYGIRVSIDWPLNRISKPMFGRAQFSHDIKNKAPRSVNDDTLTFNTQISSQWDGLRHYGYQKEALWYNGRTLEDIITTKQNGIHGTCNPCQQSSDADICAVWVENGGIVGRGILLDYRAWADSQGIAAPCFETTPITVDVLQSIAAHQGTTICAGDILLVRSGWVQAYNKLSHDECRTLAGLSNPPAIGVESSEKSLRWIWENGFAAVGGDAPSFEAWPCQNKEFWMHEWLLAGWGCPIGELFDLEQLSEECAKRKKWSFFFSSMPLNVPGGVASPPNGVAIL